ncbi:hypothetical protein [Bradyrhizobium sp. OK095]|uniref:hypothetical protein n=1 Tax=Bradyrhizobium sp. OK095 TaxID=1882760 RepID=UPI00115FC38C|nr:hypothetical protein [Bradyrhizobium sp. OK095]
MDEAILLRRVRLEEVRIVEERTPPPSTPTDERPPIRRVQGAQGFLKKNDIERLLSDLAFFAHAWASSPRRPADATCGGQVWGRACGSPDVPANGPSRLIELGAERVSTKGGWCASQDKITNSYLIEIATQPHLTSPHRSSANQRGIFSAPLLRQSGKGMTAATPVATAAELSNSECSQSCQ